MMKKDKEIKIEIYKPLRSYYFPSLKKRVEAETYAGALKLINKK